MSTRTHWPLPLVLWAVLFAGHARGFAQTPEPAAPEAVPPPPPAEAPASQSALDVCMPQCRATFVCVRGQCVSACNPPCPAHDICTEHAECVAEPAISPPAQTTGAAAATPQPASEPRRHQGLMLRVTGGLGWATMNQRVRHDVSNVYGGDQNSDFFGLAGGFALDAGLSPIENLALHGRIGYLGLARPHLRGDGKDLGAQDGSRLAVFLLAPAVSYYLMPYNVYGTLAAGITWIGFEYRDDTGASRGRIKGPGFGLNADVGKEWWVNHELVGLGVAARFWFSEVRETRGAADLSLDLLGVMLLFSMTYR